MRNLQRAFVLFLLPLLMVGTSCDFNPLGRVTRRTEVKVEIYLDRNLYDCSPESDRGIRRVEVSVHDAAHPTYTPFEMRTFQVCHPKESQALPLVMYITASSPETTTRVWLKVQGFLPEDRHVIQQNAIFGFIPQQTGLVRIYLTENCFRVRECEAYTVTCNPSAERRSCVSSVNEPVPIEQAGDAGLDADVSFVYSHDASRDGTVAASDAGSHDEGAVAQGDSARDVPAFDAIADDGMDVATMDVTARDDGMDVVEDGGMRAEAGDVMEVSAPDVRDAAVDAPPPNRTCGADLLNDVDNCGECGRRCTAGAGATPACRFGQCALVCPTGFADCDGNASNGCETSVTSDARNCGGCGVSCATPGVCTNGVCQRTAACPPNFDDCDGSPSSCETEISTSLLHCGACNRPCAGACRGGRCSLPVQYEQYYYTAIVRMDDGSVRTFDAGGPCFHYYSTRSGTGSDDALDVSAGGGFRCMIRRGSPPLERTVWCWGANNYAQLGIGSVAETAAEVQVQSLDDMGNPTPLRGIVDIASTEAHTCAVDAAGQVWCWGYNAHNQCGHNFASTDRLSRFAVRVADVSGARNVAVGSFNSCARGPGMLKCWGARSNGVLGDGAPVSSGGSLPVSLSGLDLSRVSVMDVGYDCACAIVEPATGVDGGVSDQSVRCWGNNANGIVTGTRDSRIFTSPARELVPLRTGRRIQSVHVGHLGAFLVYDDGVVSSWGSGYRGIIPAPTSATPQPVTILGLADRPETRVRWIDGADYYTNAAPCALTHANTIRCWYGEPEMVVSIPLQCP